MKQVQQIWASLNAKQKLSAQEVNLNLSDSLKKQIRELRVESGRIEDLKTEVMELDDQMQELQQELKGNVKGFDKILAGAEEVLNDFERQAKDLGLVAKDSALWRELQEMITEASYIVDGADEFIR
jgi:archaellum component FlaC